MELSLITHDECALARIVPSQTKHGGVGPTKGIYCFVIDVSGSMHSPAEVTTDDGDKISHGWSQLDIGKHSTNAFVSSLDADDYVSIVTYSDGARVHLGWTLCDGAGKEAAMRAIDAMRPERSTNLMAGLTTGFDQMGALPNGLPLEQYTINLIVTTDGMPSAQWSPARGRAGYAPLVRALSNKLVSRRGPASRPTVTSIGLGYKLDSELLEHFSDEFLHLPDPGSVGPFMVNLLAALRCTCKVGSAGAVAADASIVVSPSSLVASVPGYRECATHDAVADTWTIRLGAVMYDQPRCVVLRLRPGADASALSATIVLASAPGAFSAVSPKIADDAEARMLAAEGFRLDAVDALRAVLVRNGDTAPLKDLLSAIDSAVPSTLPGAEGGVEALRHTIDSEALLGCKVENYGRWGSHYMRSLALSLRAQRRSNFRDQALQAFGRGVCGDDGLFEQQSNEAEMAFNSLKAPEPSLLAPQPAQGVPVAGVVGRAAPAPPRALPAEFMRGGGCFAPWATVRVASRGGCASRPISEVRAGDLVVVAGDHNLDGADRARVARVVCVVATRCAGGRAMLTRLSCGLELTEWHPLIDKRGRWRFPNMLGERVVRRCSHVYNLVLDRCHVLPVGGVAGEVPCVTLGHGILGDVVEHEYWGTDAVISDLRRRDGWARGFVEL